MPTAASCATPWSNRTMHSAVVQLSCARQVVVAWLSGSLVPGLGCLFFLGAFQGVDKRTFASVRLG